MVLPMKFSFYTLGCKVNQYETQAMQQMLLSHGHTLGEFDEPCDGYIVNSCTVTAVSDKKTRNAIRRAQKLNPNAAVGVCGCYAQSAPEEVRALGVDVMVGTADREAFVLQMEQAAQDKASHAHWEKVEPSGLPRAFEQLPAGGLAARTRALLKIEDGCNSFCTYCIIPKLRGRFRSVPMERLIAQAEDMAEQGVKELILVAQETTLYGMDLYGKKELPRLLHELAQIPGIYWIRILYCYPEEITDELIDAIAAEPKVCNYLDIPIQHASDNVLKRMGRRTNQAELRAIIGKLREKIPDICLRTTLISGFPGETQEDFEELYRFVNEMEFDRLGVFPYSQEEDTPAATMEDQVPQEVKEFRRDELMELQQAIAFDKAEDMVGRILTVMIEGKVADEETYVARTYRDAPNVDGYLFVNTSANLMTGDLVKVLVTDSNEYDLIGEIYHE